MKGGGRGRKGEEGGRVAVPGSQGGNCVKVKLSFCQLKIKAPYERPACVFCSDEGHWCCRPQGDRGGEGQGREHGLRGRVTRPWEGTVSLHHHTQNTSYHLHGLYGKEREGKRDRMDKEWERGVERVTEVRGEREREEESEIGRASCRERV